VFSLAQRRLAGADNPDILAAVGWATIKTRPFLDIPTVMNRSSERASDPGRDTSWPMDRQKP